MLTEATQDVLVTLDTPMLMMLAIGMVLTGFGVGLVAVAVTSRRERAEIRARGERPGWRNANPGCLVAAALPPVLLGLMIVVFVVYAVVGVW